MADNATVTEVIDEITEAETVMDGAIIFINGVPGLIAAAVAASIANGATAEQLKPLAALGGDLKTKAGALKAALEANTPQA